MAFEHYISKGGARLRLGYTTGSCAALAAKGATQMLLTGRLVGTAELMTPKGLPVEAELQEMRLNGNFASCAVQKDAGDDADVTHGIWVYARAERTLQPGVRIEGGQGIGRVTRPGLEQPVGALAVNSVPRRMITEAVETVCSRQGYTGGMDITLSIPGGEALAQRTFNPHLGIEGGLSVLGTSGIVEPMSVQALVDTIEVELKQLRAAGATKVVLTPGNYGEAFLASEAEFAHLPRVKCSNYIGEALDLAAQHGFEAVLYVAHIGKAVKLAAGIMNTHSRMADGRLQMVALHAALAGATQPDLRRMLAAVSLDEAIGILDGLGIRAAVFGSLLEAMDKHLRRRVGGAMRVGALTFSNCYGTLGATDPALVTAFLSDKGANT